jgi:hypothetical protein
LLFPRLNIHIKITIYRNTDVDLSCTSIRLRIEEAGENLRHVPPVKSTVEIHRAWADWLVRKTGKKVSPLATEAGLSATTIARAKDEDFKGFAPRTIDAVMAAHNVPSPEQWAMGLAEDDAAPWDGPPPDEFNLKTLSAKATAADIWRVETDELAGLGYRRGDAILVDLSETPRKGDVVVAQIYDMQYGRAKTVLRLFNGPYLTTANMRGEPGEILMVDGGQVAVKGVVTALLRLRPRRPNAA